MNHSTGVLLWLLLGTAIGGLASLLTPGRRSVPGSSVMVGLGILGALLGGVVGRSIGLNQHGGQHGALAMAAVGAVVLVAVYNAAIAPRHLY